MSIEPFLHDSKNMATRLFILDHNHCQYGIFRPCEFQVNDPNPRFTQIQVSNKYQSSRYNNGISSDFICLVRSGSMWSFTVSIPNLFSSTTSHCGYMTYSLTHILPLKCPASSSYRSSQYSRFDQLHKRGSTSHHWSRISSIDPSLFSSNPCLYSGNGPI